ncbi:uromodulin-like [Gastrophryne carolinensis]
MDRKDLLNPRTQKREDIMNPCKVSGSMRIELEQLYEYPGERCATIDFLEGLRPENCAHNNKSDTSRKLELQSTLIHCYFPDCHQSLPAVPESTSSSHLTLRSSPLLSFPSLHTLGSSAGSCLKGFELNPSKTEAFNINIPNPKIKNIKSKLQVSLKDIEDFQSVVINFIWQDYYYSVSPNFLDGNIYASCSVGALPSLTYVLDTTGSMYLAPIKDFTSVLYNRLLGSSTSDGRQYTLMEFNDPNVGPLRATCSISEFYNNVYYLISNGGGDCPEYAMTGLLKALENSPAGSVVAVITDASAKDAYEVETINRIYSLIDSKQFKIADFLNFFLQLPINSTTQILSLDGTYYDNRLFYVSADFNALLISAACQSCSITLYNPSSVVIPDDGNKLISENWGYLSYVKNPDSGNWTVTINSAEYYSLRILGIKGDIASSASVCASCSPYATCREIIFSYSCVCNNGFSGDGYSCYDINECDYYYAYSCNNGYCVNTFGSYSCSCYSGFTYDDVTKTCIDIDECSNSSLNSCYSLKGCVNYYGSYSCYCPSGYYGDGYHCEVDECTKDVCGFGHECIKYSGSHSCVDPCSSYETLNDPTRSTNYYYYYYDYYYYYYYYYGRSDYYLNGWYRFTGSGGIRMPEFCPSPGHCYTIAPLWLNGSHPDISDGIVNRTVCTSYYGNCCTWTSNIMVRACPGGYHVYKFSGTPYYYSGYCTDPTTSEESCSCASDEECRLVGGHYGCYCKKSDSALTNFHPVLSCGNLEIKASFTKCQLEGSNLNTSNIHLRDKNCIGFPDYSNTSTISVLSLLKSGVCGNELENNKTHVIIKNTIFLSLNTGSSLGGEDFLSIDYSCVYPLDMVLSLSTALVPFASSVNSSIGGTGDFLITMALYQDSGYTSVYEGSEVLLTSKTNLYIGIILKSGDTSQLTVQMKNCFATPTSNQNSTSKYYIIRESCPSKQDSSINVIENGQSQKGRFSVQLFGYLKDTNVAYLHCQVHICNKTSLLSRGLDDGSQLNILKGQVSGLMYFILSSDSGKFFGPHFHAENGSCSPSLQDSFANMGY